MDEKSSQPSTQAQALANQVAAALWEKDHASQALGISVLTITLGNATLSMTVRQDMLNGLGMCHGGFIFTLADSAFAYACNSYNRNTVASACAINFLAPAHLGDAIEAVATERSRSGRTGIYDITVQLRSGKAIALFRGNSYRIDGEVIAGLNNTGNPTSQ